MSVIEDVNSNKLEQEWERLNELLQSETQIKLDVIHNHILALYDVSISLANVQDLKEYIFEHQNIDLIVELYDVVDLRFSKGHPNFIFSFEFQEKKSSAELMDALNRAIPTDEDILTKDNSFEYVRRLKESFESDGTIRCSVLYKKYKVQRLGGGRIRQGEFQFQTPIQIAFDLTNNYCYVECGERAHAVAVKNLVEKHLSHVLKQFKPFYFSQLKNKTEFQGEFSLDKQTVILLNYIENEIKDNDHKITDYISVAFANARGDKVKSVRLNGTDLLESYEVAERIQEGDKIKSVKFRLRIETDNSTVYLATVQVTVEGILKIRYSHITSSIYLHKYNRHLLQCLSVALDKVYKESEVKKRISSLLQKLKVRDSIYLQNVLAEIRGNCMNLKISDESKDAMIHLIDKYLV